ncbi:uncharacterized protein F5891DRAFT_1189320 [Suillus fuscotomentosus]|uniref:Fanconi-associated nuclease n=1 Tax=Suillus fuscotomentosus TaxID=1912939 RepID=A0AAD4HJE6_9AGAM|nr:uncharacterized protein F5891DRAFT_1189320 [Suillus fuscotomentosus]KAG1899850.1 hypothetical protein F5891DRAFT_1189320 [Suillus fuscotomentosus]
MSPSSPNADSVSTLIFSGGEIEGDYSYETKICEGEHLGELCNLKHDRETGDASDKKVNVYVRLFEDMLGTLIETEAHLFDLPELDYFQRYDRLSPNAKFLMTKLLLRKFNAWHRLDSLKYEAEIGSKEGLIQAINEICFVPGQVRVNTIDEEDVKMSVEEREIIDLTDAPRSLPSRILQPQEILAPHLYQPTPLTPLIIKTEEVPIPLDATLSAANALAGPSSIKLEDLPMVDTKLMNPTETLTEPGVILAEDESQMDLPTLLECLRVDELRCIAKQMRVKASSKSEMIHALLRGSCTQSTLISSFARTATTSKVRSTSKIPTTFTSSPAIFRQTTLPFARETAQKRLRDIILGTLGKTQSSQALLLPSLLSRFKKRSYANIASTRTKDIWPTRDALLAYEQALEQEEVVDAMFAGNFAAMGAEREFKTPAADELRFKTPVTPSAAPGAPQTPISTKTVQTPVSITFATPASSSKSRPQSRSGVSGSTEKSDSVRVRGARLVKEIFEEVYPHWQALVKMKNEGGLEGKERGYGLERFESGHVLTRLVCKGAHALGILGEHEYELSVLESLLAQRRWRRGRRGRWHERRALILEKHVVRYDDALSACLDALKDDDTHIVFRPKLDRRLTALEKKLKVEPADRHTSEWNLQPLVLVSFEGVRVRHRAASLKLDRAGRNINDSAKSKVSITQAGDITKFLSPKKPGVTKVDATPVSIKAEARERKEEKGKSIWVGRDNLEVNVETLALQWYEDQGFKGIHSETRIITTLFGILFWDIIFLPIPGAFETPFQTAPLDIAEDAFYHARRDPIETRLKELEDGRGEEIVNRVEAEHRARKTWCVGVDWELVLEGEIVKIVRCLGGTALSVICHIFCEDYAGRCSGGPDLFMWNEDTGKCKFVEVKGPGDSLQENQKLWIDVLLRAGTAVELCSVHEHGKGDENKTGKKGKSKGSTKKRRGKAKDMVESDDDDEDEVQRMCESEDDADALPVAPIPVYMDDDQDDGTSSKHSTRLRSSARSRTPNCMPATTIIELPTPPHLSKKRKLIAEVIISTPSPRKKIKFLHNSDSPDV